MTTDLIRRLLAVADDLDQRGYPYAGIIRQAAQLTDGSRCQECGEQFAVGTAAGRPPKYCSGPTRRREQGDAESCVLVHYGTVNSIRWQ